MPRKIDGYKCPICGKVYTHLNKADACRDAHDIIYVPMTRTELNRLINGLYSEDLSIIPESLFITLRKIQRKSVTDGVQKEVS